MHREDDSNFLLYIEPPVGEKLQIPVEDELVEIMEKALDKAKTGTAGYNHLDNDGSNFREGNAYKGWHSTGCGERSSNKDYLLSNGMITNSLAPFYLKWYRNSIPESEWKKLKKLEGFYSENSSEELKKTEITYFGEKAVVACDMKCNKAWGIPGRPHIYLQDPKQEIYGLGYKEGMLWMDDEGFDENDIVFLSDDELGDAPYETGTWEGGHGKPTIEEMKKYDHNKWCVRACERCGITEKGNPDGEIKIKDWSKRRYNIPSSDPSNK